MAVVDPKEQAELDQSMQALTEFIPQVCRGIYLNCVKEGFTEAQALTLAGDYIRSISPTNAK